MIIEKINEPNDIKKIPGNQLKQLAKEIRTFLIESISRTGGHLSSNLGVVELTMALHLSFDLPKDKIIWDVGHQSYTHKILTGRKNGFEELRSFGGMSGFPKRKESVYDSFDTGHSSTAISAGLGIARARDIRHESFHVVSVVGDGSLTGGMCYEALNNASLEKTNFIIVLNDNKMSISENVGGVNNLLAKLRTSRRYNEIKDNVSTGLKKIPKLGEPMEYGIGAVKDSMKRLFVHGMFFEDMDITYLGPVNGHHLDSLLRVFNEAKKIQGPVLVHVITQKGKGYSPGKEGNPPHLYQLVLLRNGKAGWKIPGTDCHNCGNERGDRAGALFRNIS